MKEGMIFAVTLLTAATTAHAQNIDGPTNIEPEKRIEALEQVSEQASEQNEKPAPQKGWWEKTRIGGTVFLDFTHISHEADGVKQPSSGTNFDLKRFYVSIDQKFDAIWSANITTDTTYNGTTKAGEIYIKKAYLQAKIAGDALVLQVGSANMPWVPFVEDLYGYRYVEKTLADRTKFATSADWGAHLGGKLADSLVGYQLSVINGAGYRAIPLGAEANRSKSLDVEGRLNLNYQSFVLAIGGYRGKLGKNVEGAAPTHHTARRFNALAAYATKDVRIGIEYFKAHNWNNVATPARDSAEGWSGFASYRFLPDFRVFGRFDRVTPKRDTNSRLHGNYYNFGVSWIPAKNIDLSLLYKRDRASNGIIPTANGKIGGALGGAYHQIGIFSQIKW